MNGYLKKTFTLALILFVVGMLNVVSAQTKGNVLMILREVSDNMEFAIREEVKPMATLLEKNNYTVDFASESGAALTAGKQSLVTIFRAADVKVEKYSGIIIPCMQAGDYPTKYAPPASVDIVKKAASAGIPIAAQNAMEMLREADLLSTIQAFALKPGVVVSGNFVTSYNCSYMAKTNNSPVDTEELVTRFVEILKTKKDTKQN